MSIEQIHKEISDYIEEKNKSNNFINKNENLQRGFNFYKVDFVKIDETKHNIFNGLVDNLFSDFQKLTKTGSISNLHMFYKDDEKFYIFNIEYKYNDNQVLLPLKFVIIFDYLYNIRYFNIFPIYDAKPYIENQTIGLSSYYALLEKIKKSKKNLFGKCFTDLIWDEKNNNEKILSIYNITGLSYKTIPETENECKNLGYVWDTPALNKIDCPFNKQYLGYCIFPKGVKRIGFKQYDPDTLKNAVCSNCDQYKEGTCCNQVSNPEYVFKYQ